MMGGTQHWNGVLTSLSTSVFDWTSSNFYAKISLSRNYYSHAVTSIQSNFIHVHVMYDCGHENFVGLLYTQCNTHQCNILCCAPLVYYSLHHTLSHTHTSMHTHTHTHTHTHSHTHTCKHAQIGSTVSGIQWYALIWQFLFSMQDDLIMKILKYQGVIYLY